MLPPDFSTPAQRPGTATRIGRTMLWNNSADASPKKCNISPLWTAPSAGLDGKTRPCWKFGRGSTPTGRTVKWKSARRRMMTKRRSSQCKARRFTFPCRFPISPRCSGTRMTRGPKSCGFILRSSHAPRKHNFKNLKDCKHFCLEILFKTNCQTLTYSFFFISSHFYFFSNFLKKIFKNIFF